MEEPNSVLENLASMKIVDRQGNTSIIFAALRESDEILELLLENEQDEINTVNKYGESALLFVLKQLGDTKVKNTVRLHDQRKSGFLKPLTVEKRAITLVLQGADTNVTDSDGNTPLILAVMKEFSDLVKLILEKDKSTVNDVNRSGTTALMVALRIKQTQTAQLLLDHGADVNVTDIFGNTPLSIATKNGFGTLEDLIYKRDNSVIDSVNIFDKFDRTTTVPRFKRYGANSNASDENTLLILCCFCLLFIAFFYIRFVYSIVTYMYCSFCSKLVSTAIACITAGVLLVFRFIFRRLHREVERVLDAKTLVIISTKEYVANQYQRSWKASTLSGS